MLSKFGNKSIQKSLIFSSKANCARGLFACAFLVFSLYAEEDQFTPPDEPFVSSLVKTQNLLSTVISSVSAISGEWVQSDTDFVVMGPEPLILNRCYTGDHAHNDKLGYNWDFNRPHELMIDVQDKKVHHAKVLARLHQSSGIATIHESSIHQDKLKKSIIPLHLSRTKGLTNCRGEMSAKTNLHNTILHLDLKGNHCAAMTGSGLLTYYEYAYQEDLSRWKQGMIGVGYDEKHAINHYRPIYEKKPNGNTLHFKKGMISATDASHTETYGDITFRNEGLDTLIVQASDGKKGVYQFALYDHPLKGKRGDLRFFFRHRFSLSQAIFTHKPSERYEYTHQPPSDPTGNPSNPLLKVKRLPNGRFQEVEYYHKGSNDVDMSTEDTRAKRIVHLDHENDFRFHRVKVIKAPVGHNGNPVITHRFIYETDKRDKSTREAHASVGGRTKIYDAYLRKTIYEYNKEHRPISIKRYDRKNKVYAEECFTWDDHYGFPPELFKEKTKRSTSPLTSEIASSLSESIHSILPEQSSLTIPSLAEASDQSSPSKKQQIENLIKYCLKSQLLQTSGAGNLVGKYIKNGKGEILNAHFFEYDKKGNITFDRFYGDLRGIQPQVIELNMHKKPRENCCEYYEKRFAYTKNRFNLLKTEDEDNGKGVEYDYYPGTDLVAAKYVKEKGLIRLRQFFYYDSHATLIKLIKDDGCEKGEENWNGLTERHITLISPTKTAPFGLAESIEHKYLDRETQAEKLLKKIHCHYSREGRLIQQDHYDASDTFRYSLYWDYDAHGNIIKEVDALGTEIVKTYDENDNLIFEIGPRSEDRKEYTYDFSNRLIKLKTREAGKSWSVYYRYDLTGNRIAEIDRYGNETQYQYDDFNRLIRTVYPLIPGQSKRPIQEKVYDCLDRPVIETDTCGFSTIKTYNARGKVTSILHPNGALERFEYQMDGNLAQSVAPNGTKTYFTYDSFGRLLCEAVYSARGEFLYKTSQTYNGFHKTSFTDPEGVKTDFEYDGAGRVIKTTCLDKIEVYAYDVLGRLNKKRELYDEGRMKVTCTEYDLLDRPIEERVEDEQGGVLKKVSYGYDLLGNRTQVKEETAAGLSQHITHYNLDKKPTQIIDPEGTITYLSYSKVQNELGQVVLQTKTTDPLGRRTIITYDAMEHPVNIQKKDISGVLLANQDLVYDGEGRVTRLVDHVMSQGKEMRLISTTFAYQERGQLTCLTQAEGLPEQQMTHTAYNSYGQKEKVIKSDGVILSYTYDPLGRLETHTASDGSINYRYQYNVRHQVTRIEDNLQNTYSDFKYDKRGRLLTETLLTGISIQYAYDQLNRVKQLILPDASEVHYSYDALNLKQVDRMKDQKIIYTHTYDTFDLSGLNLKSTALNQQQTVFCYDLHKRVLSIESQPFKQREAEYDRGGRLRGFRLEDAVGAIPVHFDFDEHDHLVREEGHCEHLYATDSLHNRLSKNQVAHVSNGLHQLIRNGEETFIYDHAGNLETKKGRDGEVSYQYDALDRLTAVITEQETTRYLYDPLNRRVAKMKGDQITRYLYVGQDEMGSVDQSGEIQELRIMGQGRGAEIGASVAIELNHQIFSPSHDFHGNIVSLTDVGGNVVETYRYTAFGETSIYDSTGQKISTSRIGNPWQFSSKRVDLESGFVYFGRRYYDPVNGRWITSDPAGLTDGPNLYAYLHHNPVQGFDRYGLQEEPYYPLQNVEQHEREGGLKNEDHQNNQEAPLGFIEKRKGKKDRMFFCGINQIAEIGISWVNGIMNSLKESSMTARALSEMADDHYVTFVYNETRGFILADLVRCFFELYCYANTKAVKNLQMRWDAYFDAAGDHAFLFHMCHSEGAIITRNALMSYPEELRQRIIVLAVAPGAYIDKNYAHQVTHYRSTRDIVPMLDFCGAYRCRDSTVVLKPHPDASWFDHSVHSPTYQDAIQYHIGSYRTEFGGMTCDQAA